MIDARKNTHLIVLPKVVLTPVIEPVIVRLDEEYRKAGKTSFVTSGLRTPLNQLQIIQDYLERKGLAAKYPIAMTCKVDDTMEYEKKDIFKWQLGWSKLLEIGVIINPPKRAQVLSNYITKAGVNRKGHWINPSPHFKGICFDVGGGDNGIADETALTQPLVGVIPGLVSILPERENNCLHHDCARVTH